MRNPFKPTAGARPPGLVGRDTALEGFREGLEDGPGPPGLLTIFTGPRGIGKTVMLSAAEDAARAAGWVVISETATRGLMTRLQEAMTSHLEELGDGPPTRRVTSLSVAGVGIATQLPPERRPSWRSIATDLLTLLDERLTGLIITKYAGVYRRRLLDAGIVVDAGRGLLDFAVPHLRQYLRDHAASLHQPALH